MEIHHKSMPLSPSLRKAASSSSQSSAVMTPSSSYSSSSGRSTVVALEPSASATAAANRFQTSTLPAAASSATFRKWNTMASRLRYRSASHYLLGVALPPEKNTPPRQQYGLTISRFIEGSRVVGWRRRHTVYHLPLLVDPAAGRVVAALQHDMVALQTARQIVPRCRDHGVLALEVADHLVGCRLWNVSTDREDGVKQGRRLTVGPG